MGYSHRSSRFKQPEQRRIGTPTAVGDRKYSICSKVIEKKGGFVGEHDRVSGEPIPERIPAKYEDLDDLVDGLIDVNQMLIKVDIHEVLAAALVADTIKNNVPKEINYLTNYDAFKAT